MRLRYLYLPDYGPLKEVAVVFGQNRHIEPRRGSVNFVVGLNGAGKSSLLRAVYDVFRSLSCEELPRFLVSLVYDISTEAESKSIVFHRPRGPSSEAFLLPVTKNVDFDDPEEWQQWITGVIAPLAERMPDHVSGDRLQGNGNLRNWLPSRLLAYTSGDLTPWQAITYPGFPVDELKEAPEGYDREWERPMGWTVEQEHHEVSELASDTEAGFPRADVAKSPNVPDERCILLSPEDAKLAAVAVGIWQAALDLEECRDEHQREAFRKARLAEIDKRVPVQGARRLLNELDWLWPTHVAFHFRNDAQYLRHPDARFFWILALADAVVAHPLDEALAVINLGPRPALEPEELVDEALDEVLKLAGAPMRGARNGAEALRRLLGGETDPNESLWSIFRALRSWRAVGLLKDVHLTVKCVRRIPTFDEALDDRIISYSSFSDGEQMLLGRMAFLLLLRRQDNSLLLLDEPETHFNDSWKRQIIDIVDDSILKDTAAQVLVSTHTSLALTDVFACEVTRLAKERGVTTVRSVDYPTFGADPGRILIHVFGASDVIGARAAEFLRSKLDRAKWPPEASEKLRSLIDEIGSGWPRAKLMDILEEIEPLYATRDS